MKQLLSFINKESIHLLRDTRTLLIIIAIPILQIILFGFAITTEVKNVKVAVYDPSKDMTTRHITDKINASEYFDVVTILHSPDEINTVFQKDANINLIIVFGKNFESNMIHTGDASMQLIADASDPNQGTTYTNYITAMITAHQQEIIADKGLNIKPVHVQSELRMLYNPQTKSSYNFVPGVMGMILMLICAMMTSISIVREKEMGTMEILLSSPIKPINILIAKVIPYLMLSLFNLTVIITLAYFLLDVPIKGSIVSLYFVSLIFITTALSLGMLVSNLVSTQVAAMMICGMGFILPVMLLSGMIFPIESMPPILQWLSSIIPARWYISAVRKIMIQGLSIAAITKELIILTSMAIALLTISLKTFKTRLM